MKLFAIVTTYLPTGARSIGYSSSNKGMVKRVLASQKPWPDEYTQEIKKFKETK